MDLNLHNKVVIVTGGASGIGEAIAHVFAGEGAAVAVIGRKPEVGEKVVAEIRSKGGKATFLKAELTREEECRQAVEDTFEKYGRIDCLVNNAGVNDGVGTDGSVEAFVESLHKNVVHYFAMLHYAKAALIQSKGNVVNVGSKVAQTGQGGTSGYAASKGGIQALTREWAVDLLPHGIRVNEVIPAETWTPQYDRWIHSLPNAEEKLKQITNRIPLGKRMTTAREVADMVVFLASDRASHITGQHIYVDGGYLHLDRAIE